jgi:hypothetical protein
MIKMCERERSAPAHRIMSKLWRRTHAQIFCANSTICNGKAAIDWKVDEWNCGTVSFDDLWKYCHVIEWLYTGFGLVIGFIEQLQIVTTALSLIHTLCSSLKHALSFLSLLCLHRLSPGNGSQRRRSLSFRVHVLTCWRMSHKKSKLFTPLNSTELTPLTVYNISNGPHRKRRSNSSYIITSHSRRTDRVENTASQLIHWFVLRICCLPTGVVYKVIT